MMTSEGSRKAAAALPLEVRGMLANLWTGKSDAKSLVDWATDQLVAGKDSPALRILAGLSGEDSREVQEYFQKAVADLRIVFPDKRDCLLYYCGDIAREVLANLRPPLQAYELLWQITRELNYPDELRCWTQLEFDLAIMEDRGASVAQQETAVRQACRHFLPLLGSFTEAVVGLDVRDETIQDSREIDGLEMDIVAHDVRKFFKLLLKKNGYVLEQLYSPLIVHATPEHAQLKEIAKGCITKHHSHHYFGFAETQWKLFDKERPRRVKPLLYVYRVLLTGIHLMRTGVVNANLVQLNHEARLPYIPDLIARKQSGERTALADTDLAFHQREYQRLQLELQAAHDATHLPDLPTDQTRAALNDLLVRLRLTFCKI